MLEAVTSAGAKLKISAISRFLADKKQTVQQFQFQTPLSYTAQENLPAKCFPDAVIKRSVFQTIQIQIQPIHIATMIIVKRTERKENVMIICAVSSLEDAFQTTTNTRTLRTSK